MPSKPFDIESLKKKAILFRRDILETIEAAGSGHPGGSLSAVEIFLTLYGYQINHKPQDPHWDNRDRVIVSKGHVSVSARCREFFLLAKDQKNLAHLLLSQ